MEGINAFHSQQIAGDGVDQVLAAVDHGVENRHFHERSLPYSALKSMTTLKNTLSLAFLAPDTLPLPTMQGTEPLAADIDSWASSALPRTKTVKSVPVYHPEPVEVVQPVPSKTAKLKRLTSYGTLKPKVFYCEPSGSPGKNVDKQLVRDLLRMSMSGHMEAYRDIPEGSARKVLENQLQQEKTKYGDLRRELKGKPHTFDRDGKVVILSDVNPDKLPITRRPVETSIVDPRANKRVGRRRSSAARRRSSVGRIAQQIPPPAEKQPLPVVEKEDSVYFSSLTTVQPSLSETIKLVEGVSLREGATVLAGPPKSPDKLSRSEYLSNFQQRPNSKNGKKRTPAPLDFGLAPLSPSSPEETKMHPKEAERVKSLFEAGSPAVLTVKTAPRQTLGGARNSRMGGKISKKGQDVNVRLTTAPDWGANPSFKECVPAVLPTRPATALQLRKPVRVPSSALLGRPVTASALQPTAGRKKKRTIATSKSQGFLTRRHLPAPEFPNTSHYNEKKKKTRARKGLPPIKTAFLPPGATSPHSPGFSPPVSPDRLTINTKTFLEMK